MKPEKPTVEQIKALYERCRTIYAPVREQFEFDEKYYELEFKDLLGIPEEFKSEGVVLPTARDMVDTCVDHTDISNARVSVNKQSTSNIDIENSEMMRKFYLGLIHRTEVESSISPWRVGAKHYWLHGLVVFKTVWDADRWTDKPVRKEGESETSYADRIDEWRADNTQSIPIVIQAVNPYNIMLDPYENGGRFVFETQEKLVMDVKGKYPSWSNPQGRADDTPVTCISFWTPFYRCELYDGEPILKGGVVEHDYGFIPYVPIDTGLGNLSATADPAKRYVGVLRHIRAMLVSESRDYSIADVVLKKTAYPWLTAEGENAELLEGKVEQTFGTITIMPKNTKIVQQSPQVPPQALQQHLSITSSYIASHAAPNALRGMGEAGVRSGVDRQQLIAEASAKYVYSTEAFKNGTAKVLANCARLMKNVIPGDIRIWAKTPTDEFDMIIKKDKMREPFNCYVEFAPLSETDEYRRHDDLERLVKSGIVTVQWARTQMSNVDPISMELADEVERLKQDPAIQQVKSQYLAGRLMAALSARSTAESLENPPPQDPMGALAGAPQPGQPQGQQPNQAMSPTGSQLAPPIPQMAPFGSAQNLQTQMKNTRSQNPINPMQGQGGGGNR
jgi:hypothetical protein